MFTGIVEEIGTIKEVKRGSKSSALSIQGELIFQDLKIGDSVAVDGVCLTVSEIGSNTFSADVMHETLERSGLGSLKIGSTVNLERAMAANGRFGGHLVSGHIDGVGKITSIRTDANAIWYTIFADAKILRYIVEKGSIAVDGISLTVATVNESNFSFSAIPHTVKSTTLSCKGIGDLVNLENDLVGKYIEKLFLANDAKIAKTSDAKSSPKSSQRGITEEFLQKYGF